MRLAAIYEQAGDGSWSGHVEFDPGICVASGATLDEARTNLREALRFHLKDGNVPFTKRSAKRSRWHNAEPSCRDASQSEGPRASQTAKDALRNLGSRGFACNRIAWRIDEKSQ